MGGARVAVIGAGVAGLAAARRLRARGLDVALLERAERAGGRATSDARDGFRFDAGAQVVSARDTAMLGLARAAGAGEAPLRPLALAQAQGGALRLLDPAGVPRAAPPPGPAARLRLARLERLLERFAPLLEVGAPERAARLDDRSAADFARLYLGGRALRDGAAPALAEVGQEDAERASRALLLLELGERGFAPRGAVRGGLGAVADGLARKAGCELGAEVRAVEPASRGLAVQVAAPGGGRTLEADAVLVATRARAAGRIAAPLLGAAERSILAGVRYAAGFVMGAALERPALAEPARVRVPAGEGLPLRAALFAPAEPDAAAPEGAGIALLVTTEAFARRAAEAPDETVQKELLAALDRLAPGAAADVRFALLRRHREAHPRFDVGAHRGVARLRRVLADRRAAGRRLYLAGDYLGGPTLEGAARSGERAAEAIAADLGV